MAGSILAATLVGSLVAAAVTSAILPNWIRVARERGLVGRDMNKPGNVLVAEAGGVWAVVGAAFGILVMEAYFTYLAGGSCCVEEVYALVALLLLSALLGFVDDILGWKRGLPRWQRVVFMAPISLPLVVIKAGESKLSLPLVGVVDLGVLYPLVAVPVGVLGAANAFNMLAGYNGLEAGLGLELMAFTAAYAWMKGLHLIAAMAVVMAAGLAAFLRYNWYPARVFPGNGFTYAVGAYYAGLVVLGNMEKFGLLLFTLYFVKALLYFRGVIHGVWKSGVEDFGIPKEDGSLEAPLRGAYSLQHLAIRALQRVRGGATEQGVVLLLLGLQALLGIILLAAAAAGLL